MDHAALKGTKMNQVQLRNRLQPFLMLMLMVVVTAPANGKGYFIDSVKGSDSHSGLRADQPWKSTAPSLHLRLRPGDTLFFACGSLFRGGLEIRDSGTREQPIVLTCYGQGEAPMFTNPDREVLNGNAIRLSGDHLVVDGLSFYSCAAAPDHDQSYTDIWEVGAIRVMPGADYCTIKNCAFSDCPKGVQSTGEYTLITRNYFHSANSRPLSTPGWGPIAIHMGNSHQEVSYNIIRDYYYVGGEFGADGGAMELDDGRNPKEDIYIHHNYTVSNMGFLEVSWNADIQKTETYGLRVEYNVSDDFQDFVMLWAPTHGCSIENNTIFRTRQIKNVIEPTVFCCDYGGVTIRNNLIVVDSTVTVFTRGNTDDHHHTHNLYWSRDGSLPKIGTVLHPTELVRVNPRFRGKLKGPYGYELKRRSPAIDKGIATGRNSQVDFVGRTVPNGKGTDIGAFEFHPGKSLKKSATLHLPIVSDHFRD